jgi:hypothetical protein
MHTERHYCEDDYEGAEFSHCLENDHGYARLVDSGFIAKFIQFDERQFKYPFLEEGSRFVLGRFASY